MRFYEITLANKDGKPLTPPSLRGLGQPGVITSLRPDGSTNPSALNVELDIAQSWGHVSGDLRSYVRIWGLGLKDISRAFDLNPQYMNPQADPKTITIKAGMAKGYPLADPSQQGTLVKGLIGQAFGNWLGTAMTLDMFVYPLPTPGSPQEPANYSFKWAKGEKLSVLVQRVLQQVMPGQTVTVDISDERIAEQEFDGNYESFKQFCDWVHDKTHGALGQADGGVVLSTKGDGIKVLEASKPNPSGNTATKMLRFQDLLGQVTWYAPWQVTAKLVMRGDLLVGDIVQFPEGMPSTVTAGSMPAFGGALRDQDKISFQGKFKIQQIHHWGNFRQADAMSWNTTIWALQLPSS